MAWICGGAEYFCVRIEVQEQFDTRRQVTCRIGWKAKLVLDGGVEVVTTTNHATADQAERAIVAALNKLYAPQPD